jgi:uncharacterized membrane protein
MTGEVRSGVAVDRRLRRVRGLLWSLLGLLAVEFALGMGVNLFVTLTLPAGYPGVLGVIGSSPLLSAHAAIAFLLLILSAVLIAWSGSPLSGRLRGLGIVLAVTLVATIFVGYSFVESQSNALSYGMALGFITALLLVVALVHLAYRPGRAQSPPQHSADAEGSNWTPVESNQASE